MELSSLFEEHIRTVQKDALRALAQSASGGHGYDGIVFFAGRQTYYHADDHAIEFHAAPHFARFAPVAGPDHLLIVRPGTPPRLVQVVPEDFWYEAPQEPQHPYAEMLAVETVSTPDEARIAAGDVSRYAFIGPDGGVARSLGIPDANVEPPLLLAHLDWYRAYKTPYEVECIREAARIAARGHRVVREGMSRRQSERQLHAEYLEATGHLETEVPYTNIIAWDDRSAILHYQTKRTSKPDPGATLLIDAGAVSNGYASDVTRTYAHTTAHPVFRELLDAMETLQRDLVARVQPGQSYIELHEEAHARIGNMLAHTNILEVEAGEAFERGFTRPFFPHGLGHHLGLQVHDIGGRQVSPGGDKQDPPAHYPFLRTTRPLEPGHVVTIEPGLYFIPMLLEPLRRSPDAKHFNWRLIDELVPFGGIRIEDDILVTKSGQEDLTRDLIPGHRDR